MRCSKRSRTVGWPAPRHWAAIAVGVGLVCGLGLPGDGHLQGAPNPPVQDLSAELPRLPPTEPSAALQTFELAPGLQLELLAAEPLVVDPVAIAWDEFERAFVAEMRGYSEHAGDRISRIRRLVDSDGDGRYDEATVFAEGLRWPTAVTCLRGGVLVIDAPDMLFFRDRDGDGVAEESGVVWSGFGTHNVQQLANNFQWGLDGQLYLAGGGNGGTLRRSSAADLARWGWQVADPAPPPLELGARDLRIDPATLELTPASGGGQFGMTFDRWGNRFVCSNSDHCQQVIVEDWDLARNPLLRVPSARVSIAADGPAAEVFRLSPLEPWRTVRTRLRVQGLAPGPIEGGGRAGGYFTSATGICAYDGDVLPADDLDSIFVGDVGSNLVHRKRVIGTGIVKSAVRIDSQTEFLRSRDNWFRPVQCAVGPDGALTILDMYRENVEHPASLPAEIKKHLDLNSGNDRGRIYRVVPRDFRPTPRAQPGPATAEQLVDMLEHPNGWHRATADRLIRERWDAAFAAQIREKTWRSARAEARIRAMHLLADHPGTTWNELSRSQDEEPYVRVHTARLADRFFPESLPEVSCSANGDRVMRVKFEIGLSLANAPVLDAARIAAHDLARSSPDSADRDWLTLAIASAAADYRTPLIKLLSEDDAALNSGTVSAALLLELLGEVARGDDDAELRQVAAIILERSHADPPSVGAWLAALTGEGTGARARIAQAMGGSQVYTVLREKAVQGALATVGDSAQPTTARTAALNVLTLANAVEFAPLLPVLLTPQQPPEIRRAVLATAAKFDADAVGLALVSELPTLSPEHRGLTVQILVARPAWSSFLLDAIETQRVSPVLLDAAARQQLVRNENPAIAARAQRILGVATRADRAAVVAEYTRAVRSLSGNVERGRTVFRKTCAGCHRLEQVGTDVGKSLSAAANQGESALLQNILDPNREVDARYLAYVVELADGRSLAGVISSESASSLTLRTADGQTVTVTRAEIESLRSTTLSLMPENLEADIAPPALADLLAYLLSQRE